LHNIKKSSDTTWIVESYPHRKLFPMPLLAGWRGTGAGSNNFTFGISERGLGTNK